MFDTRAVALTAAAALGGGAADVSAMHQDSGKPTTVQVEQPDLATRMRTGLVGGEAQLQAGQSEAEKLLASAVQTPQQKAENLRVSLGAPRVYGMREDGTLISLSTSPEAATNNAGFILAMNGSDARSIQFRIDTKAALDASTSGHHVIRNGEGQALLVVVPYVEKQVSPSVPTTPIPQRSGDSEFDQRTTEIIALAETFGTGRHQGKYAEELRAIARANGGTLPPRYANGTDRPTEYTDVANHQTAGGVPANSQTVVGVPRSNGGATFMEVPRGYIPVPVTELERLEAARIGVMGGSTPTRYEVAVHVSNNRTLVGLDTNDVRREANRNKTDVELERMAREQPLVDARSQAILMRAEGELAKAEAKAAIDNSRALSNTVKAAREAFGKKPKWNPRIY